MQLAIECTAGLMRVLLLTVSCCVGACDVPGTSRIPLSSISLWIVVLPAVLWPLVAATRVNASLLLWGLEVNAVTPGAA